MDDHATKRGPTAFLCNQRHNDLHKYSSERTPDNSANIANAPGHGLSRCSRSLLHFNDPGLHTATRRDLCHTSSATYPLEKRASLRSPAKPLFFLLSSQLYDKIWVNRK